MRTTDAAAVAALTLAALTLAGSPAGALAQGRPTTTAMTCGQAVALVRSRGAALLGTGGQTFDRFVSDRRFCQPTEGLKRSFAATRDDPRCPVGFRCVEPSGDDWFGDLQ